MGPNFKRAEKGYGTPKKLEIDRENPTKVQTLASEPTYQSTRDVYFCSFGYKLIQQDPMGRGPMAH